MTIETSTTTEDDIAEIIHPTPDGVFLTTIDEEYIRLADVRVFRYRSSLSIHGIEAVLRGEGPEEERIHDLWPCPCNESEEWLGKLFKALGNLTPTPAPVGPTQQPVGVLKGCPKIITLIDEQSHHFKKGMEIEQKIYDKEIEREERVHAGEDQAVVRKKTQVELVEYKWYLYHRGAVKTIDQINKDLKSPKDIV